MSLFSFIRKVIDLKQWLTSLLGERSFDFLKIALPIVEKAILYYDKVSTMDNTTKKNVVLKDLYREMVNLGYEPGTISDSLMELALNIAFRKLKEEGRV